MLVTLCHSCRDFSLLCYLPLSFVECVCVCVYTDLFSHFYHRSSRYSKSGRAQLLIELWHPSEASVGDKYE